MNVVLKPLIIFLGFILLVFTLYQSGYRVNLTPSYPLGLYRTVVGSAMQGDLVLICPEPTSQTQYARSQNYLGYGHCPGWYRPLIKTVIASEADMVERSSDLFLSVNGNRINHSQFVLSQNNWPFDKPVLGVLSENDVWVASTVNPMSFDSRYLGALPKKNIIAKIEPVWVWGDEYN